MSDTMLHGVLNMPPELWQDTELDKLQRYSRYLAASRRIEDDGREIERLREALDTIARVSNDPAIVTCAKHALRPNDQASGARSVPLDAPVGREDE